MVLFSIFLCAVCLVVCACSRLKYLPLAIKQARHVYPASPAASLALPEGLPTAREVLRSITASRSFPTSQAGSQVHLHYQKKPDSVSDSSWKMVVRSIQDDFSNWNMTRNGLLVTFESYQGRRLSSDPKTGLIPHQVLEKLIRPDGPLGQFAED